MTGNPIRGEVTFDAAGVTYTLVFSINALCVLEERLDMGVSEIGARLSGGMRLGFMRTLFWAGLQEHHPGLTEKDVGVAMGQLPPDELGRLLIEAFVAAFPKAEDANAPAGPPRRRRARGTSPPSS